MDHSVLLNKMIIDQQMPLHGTFIISPYFAAGHRAFHFGMLEINFGY
jgi:hypothetical protein